MNVAVKRKAAEVTLAAFLDLLSCFPRLFSNRPHRDQDLRPSAIERLMLMRVSSLFSSSVVMTVMVCLNTNTPSEAMLFLMS